MSKTSDDKCNKLEQAHLDFISTVSHELRTPLTSIRGFADTLLTSYEKLSPEQRQKFLFTIKDQSNRLIKLVENLLLVSKVQSEKESLILKSVNVTAFVESSVQMVASQYPTHKIEVVSQECLPLILVDTDKFQQIIINLLDNACKYSPDNSLVKIYLSENLDTNTVSIKVEDNGIGISEENIDKVFQKFSRIDSPLTRKIQGSGLGLFIAKSLVEKMNGNINFESGEKGTIFQVSFPIAAYDEACLLRIKESD